MPERIKAGMGAKFPRAELIMCYADQHTESIQIPVAVGRALLTKRRKSGSQSISRQRLINKLNATQRACATQRMLALLERRDHSVQEVDRDLLRRGYPPFARQHAIEYGQSTGYLSNERFAASFARSKTSAGWGHRRVEHELSRRGVDVSKIVGWPDEYLDVDGEYERALSLATKKHVREPHAYAKLTRYLLGKGYSIRVAKKAAEHALG